MNELTQIDAFESGRKFGEVDYITGAIYGEAYRAKFQSAAFWAGYAIGWMDAETDSTEVSLSMFDSDHEAQWELGIDYADAMAE